MTPQEFVRKWRPVALTERQTAQEHFGDLCRLLGEPTPIEADPQGVDYAFEKGASRATGGNGWADVWKRGCFAFEYKKRHANLSAALKQLLNYAGALANPPLLVTCDTDRIEINTNWNDLVSTKIVIRLEELLDPERLQILKAVFTDPSSLKPRKTRADVTAEAATRFASLADRLRRDENPPDKVAHFVNQILFCLFAQDSQLFEDRLFDKFLRQARRDPNQAEGLLRGLFQQMARGGLYGLDRVEWFNGSLFNDDVVLPLDAEDLKILEDAAAMNWSVVEPAIFGTLFERGLDPSKRSQLGAHYTDATMIGRIVDAVVTNPLLAEWAEVKEHITQLLKISDVNVAEPLSQKPRSASVPSLFVSLPTAGPKEPRSRSRRRVARPEVEAKAAVDAFLDRLRRFRVLDPACGSGNFLYVTLMALKDIELQVIIEAETLGIARVFPLIGPESVLGIETNSYAVELARVTVWIGEIQWMRRKGYDFSRSPVLKALSGIVEQDAILLESTSAEPAWPSVDVIVGNPPFLGSRLQLRRLGQDYANKLREVYMGRVPPGADLVCYWFEKARAMVAGGQVRRVGLLATKSIANAEPSRQVLDKIVAEMRIFEAQHNLPWVIEGAAVAVSIVCFAPADERCAASSKLDGRPVRSIRSDLRDVDLPFDLRGLRRLEENRHVAFQGVKLAGRRADDESDKDEEKGFVIDLSTAERLLSAGGNPNGRPNTDVIRTYWSGDEAIGRSRDRFVIDFGPAATEADARAYAAPYAHLERIVRGRRQGNREGRAAKRWWVHQRARQGMRDAISRLDRFLVTVEVAKHRFFRWAPANVLPSGSLVVFARMDDFFLGVLESRFHKLWANETHNPLENRPRYRIGHSFESYPFPDGMAPGRPVEEVMKDPLAAAIAEKAQLLYEAREAALSSGPERLDMTELYDRRDQGGAAWLVAAHRELDVAVAAAYGWSPDLADDEILAALGALHHRRQGTSIRDSDNDEEKGAIGGSAE